VPNSGSKMADSVSNPRQRNFREARRIVEGGSRRQYVYWWGNGVLAVGARVRKEEEGNVKGRSMLYGCACNGR